MTTFRNPLADPLGTRRGPPVVRGPQFENRWFSLPQKLSMHSVSLGRLIFEGYAVALYS